VTVSVVPGMASVPTPAPVRPLEGPFANWMEESSLSLQALYGAHVASKEKSIGSNGELSLVLGNIRGKSTSIESSTGMNDSLDDAKTIFWVQWKFPGEMGRPASLDANNRVKCIVATGDLKQLRDYKDAKIIHPAIGVRMERIRGYAGQMRPQVPPTIMRLYSIWKEALLKRDSNRDPRAVADYAAVVQSDCPCYVCGSSSSLAVCESNVSVDPSSNGSLPADIVKPCPLCLLWGHARCNESVAQHGIDHCLNKDDDFLLRLVGNSIFRSPSSSTQHSSSSGIVGTVRDLARHLVNNVFGESFDSKLGIISAVVKLLSKYSWRFWFELALDGTNPNNECHCA